MKPTRDPFYGSTGYAPIPGGRFSFKQKGNGMNNEAPAWYETGIYLEALQAYAKEKGRGWKAKLLDDWAAARRPGALQTIRNNAGPTWLATFQLPKENA